MSIPRPRLTRANLVFYHCASAALTAFMAVFAAHGASPQTSSADQVQTLAAATDPLEITGTTIDITAADATPSPIAGRQVVHLGFPKAKAAGETAVLGEAVTGPAADRLRVLVGTGRAAGNHGDLYENRDGDHSRLPPENHPQLTHVRYSEDAQGAGLHNGLAGTVMFAAPVIGNSSTALTSGPFWRSLPRAAMIGDGSGAQLLFQNYANGQVHVYPEHRDHDPEHGDLMPANTPYMLISQGSSGSDQPHLAALAMILAAFKPETKAKLLETGLLAPTIQMVFRRSQDNVLSRAAYLSGAAHPSVFAAETLSPARMVTLANAIEPGDIPPVVLLDVFQESVAVEGRDYFGAGLNETLFDTPSAIARIWRSRAYTREMVVSAAGTRDPNGRPLSFTWTVLRGDPERVRIEPLDASGATARITIDWPEPRPITGRSEIVSSRVDVGVFANNGVHDSAPAFISVIAPRHERRVYEAGPNGTIRIASIDYVPGDTYADPALFPRADWRDDYAYDADGVLLGWTRTRKGRSDSYDATGARILTRHDDTAPHQVERPRYAIALDDAGLPQIVEHSTGRVESR